MHIKEFRVKYAHGVLNVFKKTYTHSSLKERQGIHMVFLKVEKHIHMAFLNVERNIYTVFPK